MVLEDALRNIAFVIVRFSSFSAGALLFGTPVVLLLALRPALSGLSGDPWNEVRRRMSFRISQFMTASLIASLASACLGLLLQTLLIAELRGGGLGERAFDAVLDTNFGRWYAVRIPLVLALAIVLGGRAGKRFLAGVGDGSRAPQPLWWGVWGALGLSLLVTNSLSGHALVSSPAFPSVANDLIHLGAGAVWISGIVLLAVGLPGALRRVKSDERMGLVGPVVIRFSDVALVSISIVAVTGVFNSLFNVAHPADLTGSGYGRTLLVKLILFAGVLVMGGVNHLYVRAKFRRALQSGGNTRAQSLFRRTIAFELALAVGLLALTGILTGSARTRRYSSVGEAIPQSHASAETYGGG